MQEVVKLEPGDWETVEFAFTPTGSGTYYVAVNGLSDSFECI